MVLYPNQAFLNLNQGKIISGGSLSVESGGFIGVRENAIIDVSGFSTSIDIQNPMNPGLISSMVVASDAGEINLASAEGTYMDGVSNASPAEIPWAKGGELTIEINRGLRGQIPVENNTYPDINY